MTLKLDKLKVNDVRHTSRQSASDVVTPNLSISFVALDVSPARLFHKNLPIGRSRWCDILVCGVIVRRPIGKDLWIPAFPCSRC